MTLRSHVASSVVEVGATMLNDDLFGSILDSSGFGFAVLDGQGCIKFWNKWLVSMSGVTVHEAMGRTIIELFPELSNSRLASAVTATIEFGQSAHLSRSLNCAPFPLYAMPIGSEAPNRLHQTINIQPLGEGWPGCQIQIFDATPEAVREAKLRQQAKAMRVSEAKYRILAESSTVGIWQFDRQGRTINANQAMCNILGVDGVDALMEMSLSDFVDDDAKDAARDFVTSTVVEMRKLETVIRCANSGRQRRVDITGAAVSREDGEAENFIATFVDITEHNEVVEAVRHLARHDPLTGLPNRRQFHVDLENALEIAKTSGKSFSLLYLDLDHFKRVNDQLGHAAGDELLKEVARRLKDSVRETDVVTRLGGDEFAAILKGATAQTAATKLARRMLSSLDEPMLFEGQAIRTNISIGITCYTAEATSTDALMRTADQALYQAKEQGLGGYCVFDRGLNAKLQAAERTVDEARRGLMAGEFLPYYQPQINPATGQIVAVEALARWRHKERGLLVAGTFIKLLEDNGLCVTLGEQILREACMQAQNWRESGLGDLCLAVNVSVKQLMQPKFVEFVDSVLKASGFPAKLLELEITEHTIMENIDRLSNVLASLRDRGVRIAIDDFGTGYSSFMLLKSLPFDVLKIDQAFVRGPVDSELNRAIRAGLVCTARGLNRASVAEGVEDFQMIRQLAKEGCDRVQGFAVSAAIAASEIPLFIAANGNKDGVVVAG